MKKNAEFEAYVRFWLQQIVFVPVWCFSVWYVCHCFICWWFWGTCCGPRSLTFAILPSPSVTIHTRSFFRTPWRKTLSSRLYPHRADQTLKAYWLGAVNSFFSPAPILFLNPSLLLAMRRRTSSRSASFTFTMLKGGGVTTKQTMQKRIRTEGLIFWLSAEKGKAGWAPKRKSWLCAEKWIIFLA